MFLEHIKRKKVFASSIIAIMRIHFQWQCFYYTKDKHMLLVFFKCAFFLPSEKQVQQCIAVLLTRTKLLLIFNFLPWFIGHRIWLGWIGWKDLNQQNMTALDVCISLLNVKMQRRGKLYYLPNYYLRYWGSNQSEFK